MNEGTAPMTPEWLSPPAIFIDQRKVNIDDLIDSFSHPGAIIRCDGNPRDCILLLNPEAPSQYDYIAGMVSEGA